MKLYIPPYLRTGKIPVLKQLYEMVASYSEEYTDKEELDSFNDYKASLINDPVLLFLDYCVPSLEDMKIKTPRTVEANIAKLAGKPYSIISRCINTSFSRNYRYITPPEWLSDNNKRPQENINSITADEHKANLEQYKNNPNTFKF